jgi:hypothetical protein
MSAGCGRGSARAANRSYPAGEGRRHRPASHAAATPMPPPSSHPATTSVNQCTPRYRTQKPIQTTLTSRTAAANRRTIDLGQSTARKIAVATAAVTAALAEGIEDPAAYTRAKLGAGRGRPIRSFNTKATAADEIRANPTAAASCHFRSQITMATPASAMTARAARLVPTNMVATAARSRSHTRCSAM